MAEESTWQKRPRYASIKKIPDWPAKQITLIRALTRQIQKIGHHIGADTCHWHDQRSRKALEYKINLRAATLEALRAQDYDSYALLILEIGGDHE